MMTPIGMKNVVPPYLILIDYIFTSQQGGILEVYIDDFIVKSKTELDIVQDLQETFENMR